MSKPLDHALMLASRHGWHSFPCKDTKAPATPRGFHDAASAADALAALFARHPGPLVGVRTGKESDLAVLDLDAGTAARDWWAWNRRNLPKTRTVRTRSGGLHLYFRHRHGLRCSASVIASGVDVRGDGGYVISWPGAGLPVLADADLAPWPDLLSEALRPRRVVRPESPEVPSERTIAGLVRLVANAQEKTRNSKLFWAACRAGEAITAGKLSEPSAIAMLIAAATAAGLPDVDASKTVASGIRHGLGSAPHAR